MATSTFRQAPTHGAGDQVEVQLTQAADIGDTLVALHGTDFYQSSDVGAPTGGHTWTQQAVDTNGADLPHLKVFTAPVDNSGDQVVSFPTVVDTIHYGWLGVLINVDSIDVVAGGGSGSATDSHATPSISPVSNDALLLCGWIGGGDIDDNTAVSYIAIPVSMTDRGHQQGASGPFHSALQAASEALLASGATGTRTATFSRSAVYASIAIALAGTSNGGSGVFEPILMGTGSIVDQIMAGLESQGFTEGSLVDREYARLLAKLTLTAPVALSIQDLYNLAGEENRITGLVTV